jgi:glycosyltransferase involved in cell wall biosynthesis
MLQRAGLGFPGLQLEKGVSRALLAVLQRLREEAGLELLQMEESFGWARRVAPRSPVPVVARLAGPRFLTGTGRLYSIYERERVRREGQGIRRAHALIAPSQDVLDRVAMRYRGPLPYAEVIPNPVTLPRTPWQPEACDPSLVLFVGRFDRVKGGDIVVRAFRQVIEIVPAARLCFVGRDRGYIDDSGRRFHLDTWLQRELPDPAHRERVEYLGFRPQKCIDALRLRAGVVVVASRYETFCNAVAEALVVGAPVVATRVGGIPEIVEDSRTGILVAPGDPLALAEGVVRLLRDRHLAAELGANARRRAAEMLDPMRVGRRVLSFYGRVLEQFATNAG